MSLDRVDQIVNAVLYEGYILYPYRPSAIKNQRRFNFGVLVPAEFSAREVGSETSEMRTECLVLGTVRATLSVRVRFLQVDASPGWQEAVEQEVPLQECSLGDIAETPLHRDFFFPPVEGAAELSAIPLADDLFRVRARIWNRTAMPDIPFQIRDEILPYSLASAHTILGVKDGEFVSLIDPPERFRDAAAACHNAGAWPVLVGEPGERDAMLSSPIILYDYPQVAEESPGDLFDGAEIDEILTLRILTMTDDEKQEMRQSGDRARQILERTEALPAEHFMKLHGALRTLRPSSGENL
jgi:hydrogenase maturation protease